MVEVALAFNLAYLGFDRIRTKKQDQIEEMRLEAIDAADRLDSVANDYAYKCLEMFPRSPEGNDNNMSWGWFPSFLYARVFKNNIDDWLSGALTLVTLFILFRMEYAALWGYSFTSLAGVDNVALAIYWTLFSAIVIPPCVYLLWQWTFNGAKQKLGSWLKHLKKYYKTVAKSSVQEAKGRLESTEGKITQAFDRIPPTS